MKHIVLNNGVKIPILGLGTYKLVDYKEVKQAIFKALDLGYRLIDTAEMYANEYQIGRAIKEYGIPRDQLFITSKIWDSSIGYDYTIKSFEATLERLKTDYLDLYLIHWPRGYSFIETWSAMTDLYKEGRIRAIGVSNFHRGHLEYLKNNSEILPVVNQIEIHPYFIQEDLIEYCKNEGIIPESWSPLAKGRVTVDNVLSQIAEKYGKTPAQVAIRWHIDRGFIVIPKSGNPKRIAENFDVFDFELSEEDIKRINELNTLRKIGPDPDSFLV